jgi:ribonuclease VapC
MFVDASALLAILLQEPEADILADRLAEPGKKLTSAVALFETVAALMRRKAVSRMVAEDLVRRLLVLAGIEIVPVDDTVGRAALEAFDRYGKGGGHPAQLNMGDCFAYAVARIHGVALLYKGNDFARTDLAG